MTTPIQASRGLIYRFFSCWAATSYRFAGWVLLAAALIGAACAVYTARNLGMDTDTTDMLSEDLPFRANDERYRAAFPEDADILLLVLEAPTPEQAQAAAGRLAARLEQDKNFHDVYAPNVDEFLIRNGLLYQDVPELERITDRLAAAQPLIARIAEDPSLETFASVLTEAVDELRKGRSLELRPVFSGVGATVAARLGGEARPLSWQTLFSGEPQKSRYRQLIMVKPVMDYTELFAAEQSIASLRATARELGITEDSPMRLHVTGEVALAYEELNSALSGMEYAGIIALLMVAVVLYIGLRAVRPVAVLLLSLISGLLLTAAFATAAVGHLNVISIAFAVLYIGLGLDFATHFLMRHREILGRGLSAADAIHEAGGESGGALFACALTTALAFYAFMPTAYRGVAELGLISGTGMLISLMVTLTLVPALQRYLPTPRSAIPGAEKQPLGKLLEFTLRWRKPVYVITVVGFIAAAAILPRVKFDYNLLNMQNAEGEAVQAFRILLADTDSSPWHAVALVNNRDEADLLAQRLKNLPAVSRVVTILDFVPGAQDEKLALIEEMALTMGPVALSTRTRAAGEQASVEQHAALSLLAASLDRFLAERPDHSASVSVRNLKASLTGLLAQLDAASGGEKARLLQLVEGDLLATLPAALHGLRTSTEAASFDEHDLPAKLSGRWHSQSGEYRVAIYPAEDINDNQALRRFVRAVQKVAPQATGAPMVSLEAGEAVVEAFVQAFTLAIAGVVIVLLVLLRSVVYSLLVLVPLMLAAIFTTALTVVLNVPFNFANIIALPLLLGIGIDSALHMVHRSRRGGSIHENLIHTSTTRAIFFSSLTTLAGFGSLTFSSHPGTASMGILLTVGLIFTLICTLVILPALMRASTHRPKS
ncbi:MAG: MMPL family transporter [Nitrosospira sp.]|nr:MMPL family transporter [Nitrosospira sp.]